jgi:acyl-CoA thioesterase I
MTEMKTKIAKSKLLVVLIAILVVSSGLIALYFESLNNKVIATHEIRVACLGDSITELTKYPEELQSLLGFRYKVGIFGVTGATILLNTDRPYLNQTAFEDAKNFLPDIVVLMLGTNDARANIFLHSQNLEADFNLLVEEVQQFPSNPRIWVAIPPPIFDNTLDLLNQNLVDGVIPHLQKVANERGIPTINIFEALANHFEYFPDGVHPNDEGAKLIAKEIFVAINGSYPITT